MWTRRQLLARAALTGLGVCGTALAVPGDAPAPTPEGSDAVPDGSASRGMITTEAENAIERGLQFLAARRHSNGRLKGAFGTNAYTGNTAVTSLAALAFMAAGNQPNRGTHGKLVTEAVRYVLSQENVGGDGARGRGQFPGFLHNPQGTPHGPMYGHGFATLFLAEVSGMVQEPQLRDDVFATLKRATALIVDKQNREGGWRYLPNSQDADLSVTVAQIMALRAARNAGIKVDKPVVDRCIAYVKKCQDLRQGWFRYMAQGGGGGGQQGFARTAAGVAALNAAGVYKGPEVENGLAFLRRFVPTKNGFMRPDRPDMHYYYGHYYAVQAMWTAGGVYWSEWYPAIRDELLERQRSEGCWLDQICSHYATAMACLILQVPNNYLPILQK